MSEDLFTPEDLSEEHRLIGRTADEFWRRDVEPSLEALHRHDPGVARTLLRKAAAVGLTAMQTPEVYGGLGLDLPSVMVAIERLAADASYLGWHLGHSGIGTLPLVYYGTDAQKERYLPRLASAELIGAYALTEPEAGSDAMGIRTRASLSADGRHYLLNGRKMWITNGGEADLFTVFAKVDGLAFTAFLVERSFGVRSGAEERKMGLAGTSTTALYFDQVPVPVENVLGEIGQGHRIAFTVLNAGRLKIGPNMVGGARAIVAASIEYARARQAFGQPISSFGAIQQKLAACATRLYLAESATWRAVGMVERAIAARRADGSTSAAAEVAAFEDHAVECAIIKVLASEMLDAVADEGVQIHGGHGYHRDAFVERAYRDARINRIFEGTNEINRLLITSQLFKRAGRGSDGLLEAAARVVGGASGRARQAPAADAAALVANARTLTLLMLGTAHERYGARFREPQEVALHIADGLIETFAMEAGWLRARKLAAAGVPAAAGDLSLAASRDALRRVARAAEVVIATSAPPSDERATAERLRAARALSACGPIDEIALGRSIAARLIEAGRYEVR